MTLLDYFAGQALAGMLADSNFDPLAAEAAKMAYNFGQAMLDEKVKRANG